MFARPRRHCVEAQRLALSLGTIAVLAQVYESDDRGGAAGGRALIGGAEGTVDGSPKDRRAYQSTRLTASLNVSERSACHTDSIGDLFRDRPRSREISLECRLGTNSPSNGTIAGLARFIPLNRLSLRSNGCLNRPRNFAIYHLLTFLVVRNTGAVVMSGDAGWNLPLDRPIEIEDGLQQLQTLGEVGAYILALPETVRRQELWQAAAKTVLEAAQSGHTGRVALVFHMAALMSGRAARSV
jgi:hypothetical protein